MDNENGGPINREIDIVDTQDGLYEEYQAYGKEWDEYKKDNHLEYNPAIFGAKALWDINEVRADGYENIEHIRHQEFNDLRWKLNEYKQDPHYQRALKNFISESIVGVPEFSVICNSMLQNDIDDSINVLTNPDIVSDDVFEKILQYRSIRFSEASDKFNHTIPRHTAQFWSRLNEFLVHNKLNPDWEALRQRNGNVELSIADPLSGKIDPNVAGYYLAGTPRIFINHLILDDSTLKATLYHEMLHRVSGHRHQKEEEKIEDDTSIKRIGFAQYERLGKKDGDIKFDWLNEAVTTTLAFELSPDIKVPYTDEVRLFGEILSSGKLTVNQNVLYEAYFEEELGAKWEKLVAQIDQAYTPGFLDRLDEYVKKRGVNKALAAMQEDWRIIAQAQNYSLSEEPKSQ